MDKKESTWHYGLIRTKTEHGYYYAIHEIYPGWLKKDELTYTEKPIDVGGDSFRAVMWTLEAMRIDLLRQPMYEVKRGKLVEVEE